MEQGCDKKNNIFIVGPTNCAKSFCIKPLRLLFNAYTIPDDGSHRLETLLDGKEILYLNDFEWDPRESWTPWSYFKNLLEGEPLEVARPKNRGGNKLFDKSLPVIGTCPKRIELLVRGQHRAVVDEAESRQMDSRIHYIRFSEPIESPDVVKCKPCAHCGARLYLEGRVGLNAPVAEGVVLRNVL